MMAVVICMVAAIAIRSLITNIYLSKIMGVSNEINVIWECVLSLIFIVINLTLPMYIAFFVYLTACRYYRLVDDYVGDKIPLWEKIMDRQGTVCCTWEKTAFEEGLKVGIRLMMEAYSL